MAGAALLAGPPLANATQDPADHPSGNTSSTSKASKLASLRRRSAYLFSHPDLNGFMSGLQGLSLEQVAQQVRGYMVTHHQERAEMAGIRQPLMDIKNHRGGALVSP